MSHWLTILWYVNILHGLKALGFLPSPSPSAGWHLIGCCYFGSKSYAYRPVRLESQIAHPRLIDHTIFSFPILAYVNFMLTNFKSTLCKSSCWQWHSPLKFRRSYRFTFSVALSWFKKVLISLVKHRLKITVVASAETTWLPSSTLSLFSQSNKLFL